MAKTKLTAHQLWLKSKKENLTPEKFKKLLIDEGVIIPKEEYNNQCTCKNGCITCLPC